MKDVKPRQNIREAIEASRKGDIPGLKAWLREGNNPNAHDPSGWRPLLWAAVRGHHEAVALLLDNEFTKADVTLPHRESSALAIHMAGHSGNVRTAEIILDHRPDKVPCGIITVAPEQASERIKQGFTNIIMGIDVLFLHSAALGAMAQIVKS